MNRAIVYCGAACLAGLAAIGVTSGTAQMPPPSQPRFERGDSVVVAGTHTFDRIVYLPVRVNGAGPFPFVLDTGAGTASALDQSVADSLGLQSTLLMMGGGGAGEETLALSLGGLSFEPYLVAGISLHRMDPHWGKRKDGLIGGDLLSTLVTRIDYTRPSVAFHDARKYEYQGPGEVIPLQVYGNIFVNAQVLLYGQERPVDALMMVDTGVRVTTFNAPFSRAHGLKQQSPATLQGVTGFGVGGVSRGIVGRVLGIRLGSILIENPVTDFSVDERGALADTGFSGIIGADILSRFHVVLDYARARMIIERNAWFARPFEYDMSGLRFVMEGSRFEILKVFSVFGGSPAESAGILPGDVVTAIDGRDAASFTRETLREYLERAGAEVRLAVRRDRATREVTLRLRRLV
jgi:hypothetical protein